MVPLAAAAQQIGGVTVDPPQVMVGQPFEAVVSISSQAGSFFCGLVVSMGDGNTREIRVAEKDIPLKMGHQYKVPGTYSITVEGKLLIRGFRTAPACDGRVISVPILVAAGEPSVTTRAVVAQPVQDPMAELRQSAAAGDVDAMFQLGNGFAQQGNNVEAVRWFRSASERGHVKAINALGFMYEEGQGVPQNFEQASNLYMQAMKRGDPDAMVNRGVMLAQGKGIKADSLQAYMHFLLAAAYAQDNETRATAVKLKDEIASKLSKQQISRGQALADKFAKEQIK